MSKIPHDLTLNRDSRFSYTCNRCARCCFDRQIQLNPYEVARLAKNQSMSSGKLIQEYLESGKPYLRRREGGELCVFDSVGMWGLP